MIGASNFSGVRTMSMGKRLALSIFTFAFFSVSAAPAFAWDGEPRWLQLIALRDQGISFPIGSLTTSEKFWLAIGLTDEARSAQGLALSREEKLGVRATF